MYFIAVNNALIVQYVYCVCSKWCSTHNVCAVGVVELAGAAAVAGEHLGHVLGLIFREPHEAHARASEHF